MTDAPITAEMAHMPALDAGAHEGDCKRFPTGWLCTTSCPVEATTPPGEQADR